jgi:aminopeptidase N
MFKNVFFLLMCISSLNGFAQQIFERPCAITKQNNFQKKLKPTRTTAIDNALMAKYDVQHYELEIAAENNTLYIVGNTTISSKALANIDTFAAELSSAHTIDSVLYNGMALANTHIGDMFYATLSNTIVANTNFSITIYYHGTCPSTGASAIGYGFNTDQSPSWGNSVTWTLSQPFSAYQWFPCKQQLQDKADSSSVAIITSNTNKAASNGLLQGVDSLPNNKLKFRWRSKFPIDYYLINLSVAQYVEYNFYAHPTSLPNDSVLIQNFVYNNPNTLPYFKNQIDTIANMINYFSDEVAGLYPFYKEKYGTCMAPLSGGMEHQTMTTEGFHEFTINAHELFHQWFGDHVTCKTWSDIFINEGFASYGEYLALAKLRSYNAAQADMMSVHKRVKNSAGGSIYFTDTTNARIFSSRLSYDKGAAVLHTLRYIIGDSSFFASIKLFQAQYANSLASITDFKAEAESVSGKNLNNFFNEWIYGEGYVNYDVEFTSSGNAIILQVKHTGSVATNNMYTTPLQIKCLSAGGDTLLQLPITSNAHTFYIPTNKIISGIQIDPNNWIIDTAKITKNPNLLLSTNQIRFDDLISIYPNPATNTVLIDGAEFVQQFSIVDMTGRTIKSGNQMPSSLNIATWANGVYSIVLLDQFGASRQFKLVVQH